MTTESRLSDCNELNWPTFKVDALGTVSKMVVLAFSHETIIISSRVYQNMIHFRLCIFIWCPSLLRCLNAFFFPWLENILDMVFVFPLIIKISGRDTSLVIHWLRLCLPMQGTAGLIPGQETKIPHCLAAQNKARSRSNIVINPIKTLIMIYIKNL